MNTVLLENVVKSFGEHRAVAGVSLAIRPGEIFGLLGPNGAGKTTLLRLTLDILQADSGRIDVFGGPMTEAKKSRIGYLPEERGLYADVRLWQVIMYLASLKGMERKAAATRAEAMLKELDLWEHRGKKLNELSRGMHQKAQFIVTVLHDPDLILVDEPFSGLDPVNTELIKQKLLGLRNQGKTIVMSTHQMHQVEEMCDRIGLINQGEIVLEGGVAEVRQRFAGNVVEVRGSGPIGQLPEVAQLEQRNGLLHLTLAPGASPQLLLREMVAHPDITLDHFAVVLPGLNEIFIHIVGGGHG